MKKISFVICVFFMSICVQVYSQIDTLNLNPEEHNFNTSILSELNTEIDNNDYGDVHSLLIVRNGSLVFEKHSEGFHRDQLHPLYSATKTITSALVGIAVDQGKINSVDDYLLDFFPEYTNILNNDSLKKAIKVKHLLTMTAGFANEDGIWESDDWIEYMLNIPMSFEPGEVWNYSGGSSILLSGIIQNQSGMTAEDFAKQYLFKPLGISEWHWNKSPNDLTATSGGLQLRPLDMALFGQLYLQKGVWNGNQIISENWIDESVKVHVDFTKNDRSYGYHLYQYIDSSSVSQMLKENDIYFASGANEQKIYVIPHLECVVTITSDGAKSKAILRKILSAINDRITSIVSTEVNKDLNSINEYENYPNPFEQSTTIKYNLRNSNKVILKIYDQTGHEIETLINTFQIAGQHEVTWQSKGLPSGIYYCKLEAEGFLETKKFVLK